MKNLGDAIRNIRTANHITLQELAARTSLSASSISKIERGVNSPSFNNLQKICQALGIDSADLITYPSDEAEKSDLVIRKDERELVYDYNNVVRYESIRTFSSPFSLNVMTISGSRDEYSASQHTHDEFGIVVKGVLSVRMNEKEYLLNEGDCILIKAGNIHMVQKASQEDCISYWIVPHES